jgi:hypothetical protein
VLAEIARVLKPGAKLALSTPNPARRSRRRSGSRCAGPRCAGALPSSCFPEAADDAGSYHPYRYHHPLSLASCARGSRAPGFTSRARALPVRREDAARRFLLPGRPRGRGGRGAHARSSTAGRHHAGVGATARTWSATPGRTRSSALNGSPVRGQQRPRLLARCATGSRGGGVALHFDCNALTVKPCQACGHEPTTGYCIFHDDMDPIYARSRARTRSRSARRSTSTRVSAQLKLVMDRCNCITRWCACRRAATAFRPQWAPHARAACS